MQKLLCLWIIILLCGCVHQDKNKSIEYVNPFIGTGGHGHTFPGATLPFGMVQLSPDTRIDSWDGCSGYHYSDSTILGFSHTHLSGTGCADYGDIRFMPITGQIRFRPGKAGIPGSGYSSSFLHSNEKASPGYYKVLLDDSGILAELTTSLRCGFHRYTFPESDSALIVIDLKESIATESTLDLQIVFVNDHEICGYRKSSGWATHQVVYFDAVFSEPFIGHGIISSGDPVVGSDSVQGDDVQAFVRYKTEETGKIMVKVGISSVSIEGARGNLQNEITDWDFDRVKYAAEQAWKKELDRISIKGGTKENKVKFYTALYHAFIAPNLFTDADGQYRGNDGQIHKAEKFEVYTVFSLWDTYRALHPLLSFLQPERTVDFINTFIDIREKRGLLPVWELAGNETNCMIGYHSVPVIADTYFKGLTGFDPERAYEAAKNSAMQDHFGLESYKRCGYIPAEIEGESVSKTLEYAYDDWCIAMMAKDMGKDEDYRYFIRRAQSYKNLYDPATGFIRGKRNGMFTEPFDPTEVNFMLTEANTWQYTFYVPQDINGLIDLMGGDSGFEAKLDTMFAASANLSGRQQADITGLIGQYAHGNEPSHHMAYLYNYVGKAYKSQKIAGQIMNELYGPGPDGLCGNEDCGQMSAWFVLSALGFYPVTPGSGIYAFGTPLFDEMTIHMTSGRDFTIKAKRHSPSDIYIESAELNGQMYFNTFLIHEDLIKGGELEFQMGSQPNYDFGVSPEHRPSSAIGDELIVPVPYFTTPAGTYQDSTEVYIHTIAPEAQILYAFGGEDPSSKNYIYKDPIQLHQSEKLTAIAKLENGQQSLVTSALFFKIHHDWKVTVKSPYNPQYTAGGDMGLIDGQHGGANFRTGAWQGYHGVDFEAIIDLGKIRQVSGVSATFLQDQRSWIFMPEEVAFSVSDNAVDFKPLVNLHNDVSQEAENAVIKDFHADHLNARGRYVRVTAKNIGTCPPWHPGAGEKAWIFTDEITIE